LPGLPLSDHLTFSGSGEPTLSLAIGRVIRFLKDRFPHYRVAVLTNGCLLHDPAVRADLLAADVVLPTLSSVNEETFRRIHRPSPGILLEAVLGGLVQFRKESGVLSGLRFLSSPASTRQIRNSRGSGRSFRQSSRTVSS